MFDIIINPAGASGRSLKYWQKAETVFRSSHVPYTVHYSSETKSIGSIVRELTCSHENRNLVIAGGDGTMNQAVNSLMDFEHTKVGFLPCGSGNDLARALHMPSDALENAQRILQGNVVRRMDVGEVIYLNRSNILQDEELSEDGFVHHRFLISSGAGFDAAICQQVAVSKAKKALNKVHLGKLIYIGVAVKLIARQKTVPAWITFDGKTREADRMLLAVCMNEPYEGGGFMFCPEASGNDGKLDYCFGDSLSHADFFRIFPYAYKGNHVKFNGVYTGSMKEMEIRTEEPVWIHTDGEVSCMSNHVSMHLLDTKLAMMN